MATKQGEMPKTFGLITFGYCDKILLPLVEATQFIALFEKAQRLRGKYEDGVTRHYIGGPLPDIKLELFSGSEWLAAKLNGEYTE